MQVLEEQIKDVLVLRPLGRLDSNTSPEFERRVLAHIDGGATRVLIDLAQVDYVSSAGLRVLLVAGKKVKAAKGRLSICALREQVRDVFEMSGFISLFPVHADAAAALAAET